MNGMHLAMIGETKLARVPVRAHIGVPGSQTAPERKDLPGLLNEYIARNTGPMVSRVGGSAILRIDGPLMNEVGWLYESMECLTHGAVSAALKAAAADASVHTVCLDLQCPGWGVEGSSDTIAALMAVKAAGKRLIAYIHDMAASGGMWMAALCDEVSVSPSGWAGSIGSIILTYDSSEAYAKMGVTPVVVASTPEKAMGYPGVAISDEWKARMQRVIDLHQADFVAAVVAGRGVDAQSVINLKAAMLAGPDAVAAKLADQIETPDAWLRRVGELQPKSQARGAAAPSQRAGIGARHNGSTRMDFDNLTVADLRANCGQLVREIEQAAVDRERAEVARTAALPAGYPDLKANFGGDAAFIVECQENAYTLAQAHTAYAAKLRADLAAAQKVAGEAANKLADMEKTRGADPIDTGAVGVKGGAVGGAANKHPFVARCEAIAAEKKITLGMAQIEARKQDPAGYQAYMADTTKAMQARRKLD